MTNFSKSQDLDHEQKSDAVLNQALKDFRSSVHAWSEAALNQPHLPVKIHRTSWRMAVTWALGCVLISGSVGGGLFDRHHKQELARIAAAAEAARQQRLVREQRAQKENEDLLSKEDLLAKVDSDVSRSVPSAMEPLAQLMSEDETQ